MATIKKTIKAQPATQPDIPDGVLHVEPTVENIENIIKFALVTGQEDKISQDAWDMLPNVPRPIGMEKSIESVSDDVLIIEVRDLHGNLLFKYNDRTGCIEFLQRGKPDGRGGKFPPMLYLIPVQQMMALGRHNLFSTTPQKTLQVNGIVTNEPDEVRRT